MREACALLQAPLVLLGAVFSHQESKEDILRSMTIKVSVDDEIASFRG